MLRAPYLRYVDDCALFAEDPARLEAWRARAERFSGRPAAVVAPGEENREIMRSMKKENADANTRIEGNIKDAVKDVNRPR